MEYDVCKCLLKSYFSEITYIDDRFDLDLVTDHLDAKEIIPETVPLPFSVAHKVEETSIEDMDVVGTSEKAIAVDSNQTFNQLAQLLLALNDTKYDGIRLNPIFFESTRTEEFLIGKMINTPLSIIDWDLRTIKALPIVKKLLEQTTQLKVVIIYTNGYDEAIKTVEDVFGSDLYYLRTDQKQVTCIRQKHKSLVIIASKRNHNLLNLLEIVCNVFIESYGILATSLLDFSSKVIKKNGDLFESFCKPFEDLYFLQMYYSEIGPDELPNYLTSFILNKIQADVYVDSAIIKDLIQYQKLKLKSVGELEEEEFKTKIRTTLDALSENIPNEYKEICDILHNIPIEMYRSCLIHCNERERWDDVVNSFSPLFNEVKKIMRKQQYENLIAPYIEIKVPDEKVKDIKSHKERIENGLAEQIGNLIGDFKQQVLPVFLQIIISDTALLSKADELILNIKYNKYAECDLNNILAEGAELRLKEKQAFLVNKMHFGDILISKDDTEYLLCISPPCDVFRPEKTDCTISFVCGTRLEPEFIRKTQKENVHISAVPYDSKVLYIKWKLFDVKNFHLEKTDDYNALCRYNRPLRMDDQYIRQIANKFTAYFSRAGVDELFIKTNRPLMNLFK